MKRCTGECSRLSLNYDSVFLVLVRSVLAKESPSVENFHCLLHPTKKRVGVKNSPSLAFASDASILLTYYKLLDDKADESGLRRSRSFLARLLFHRGYRLAKKRHPELDASIRSATEELQKAESSPNILPPEAYAEISAKMVEAVFADGFDKADKRIASAIGKSLGKWVYLVDAADDWEKDRKKGRFNPFVGSLGENPTVDDWQAVRLSLFSVLKDLENAILLLDFPDGHPEIKELILNILYLGLVKTADRIFQNKGVPISVPTQND